MKLSNTLLAFSVFSTQALTLASAQGTSGSDWRGPYSVNRSIVTVQPSPAGYGAGSTLPTYTRPTQVEYNSKTRAPGDDRLKTGAIIAGSIAVDVLTPQTPGFETGLGLAAARALPRGPAPAAIGETVTKYVTSPSGRVDIYRGPYAGGVNVGNPHSHTVVSPQRTVDFFRNSNGQTKVNTGQFPAHGGTATNITIRR